MDVVSHGLASYALTRAIFPRTSRVAMTGAIVAGVIADVDVFSAQFAPSAFLRWHRTYLHSVIAAMVIGLVASGVIRMFLRSRQKEQFAVVPLAALAAALLHVAMDFCQNERVQLLWPFRSERYSADLVAGFDLWILLILLAGALLPQLFALITEEIGAKSKAPRGRIGAILALTLVVIYIGGRFVLHKNALAMMEAHTYRREYPRKIAALAESDSPLHWRGIVETERALHDLEVNLGGRPFDPDGGIVSYKPEPSPPLESAQKTGVARRFLQVARFPKAGAEKTEGGYRVEIRDFAYLLDARAKHVMAVVETDPNAVVISQELIWQAAPK